MKIVILAGGGGTRLFPLSRSSYPKQFLQINGEESLLTQTIARFLPMVNPTDILVVTNANYQHHVKAELANCAAQAAHVLLEPVGRNTAPAIALAMRYCLDKLGVDKNEVVVVSPSDHIIHSQQDFAFDVKKAEHMAAQGRIVTFGIKPDKPETGYGYIHAGSPCDGGFLAASFKEKPDKATAERYLAAGGYYWNSGIFAFTVENMRAELKKYQPDIYRFLQHPFEEMSAEFQQMPNISIDYAVAEKSDKMAIVPMKAYWNDIGSWDAVYDVMDKDEAGNAVKGDCLPLHCQNTLMISRGRLLAGIGLENLLAVATDDVIVVAQRGDSQQVKELVAELSRQGRKEAAENTTVYRPWGSYTVMGEGKGYKLKKIRVDSGQKLSLQLHYHRSEHWVIIGGTAKVTLGETEKMVLRNESVYIPPATRHRLENPGRIPLEVIEIQNGDYLEEDDIVRFEDCYGRV